jgi:hypothetical protein
VASQDPGYAETTVVIAAIIFLNIFNVFLLALGLFGGRHE